MALANLFFGAIMSRKIKLLTAALVCALALAPALAFAQQPAPKDRPNVEVVFVVDTTGSMGGLIDAAKQKIWSISNQIASGTPTPNLKIGLVAYRDRGDEYITQITDLTDDLDAIHAKVMKFQAKGGGDFPESVNEALFVAVNKIKWSEDKKTLKIIFLVGDAPPHMDYKEVQYPETCKTAVAKDIIINTVQCGNDASCKKFWLDISRLSEGSYVQISAKGGPVVVIATPFDADLAKINSELASTTVVYGSEKAQKKAKESADGAAKLAGPAAADRAAYNARTGGNAAYDLIDNINKGKVKLEDLKKEELPEEMRKMTLEEQKTHLDKLTKRRAELNMQVAELDKKRSEFITKKLAEDTKNRAADSFDNQVLRILQTQARRNGIEYSANEEKKKKD
jgi:Mg-chelatase subunit ChlD